MYKLTLTHLALFAILYLAAVSAFPQAQSAFHSKSSTFELTSFIPSLSAPTISTYSPLASYSGPVAAYAGSQDTAEGIVVIVTPTRELSQVMPTPGFGDSHGYEFLGGK